jgi:hypothetical protein
MDYGDYKRKITVIIKTITAIYRVNLLLLIIAADTGEHILYFLDRHKRLSASAGS